MKRYDTIKLAFVLFLKQGHHPLGRRHVKNTVMLNPGLSCFAAAQHDNGEVAQGDIRVKEQACPTGEILRYAQDDNGEAAG